MKVKILTPVQHDARSYPAGEIADLPRAAAESLVDCGAAQPMDTAADRAAAKAEAQARADAEAAQLVAEQATAEAARLAAEVAAKQG